MKTRSLLALPLLVLLSCSANAALLLNTWHWVASPTFQDANPGPDNLWGGTDDFLDIGRNSPGYGSIGNALGGALYTYFGGGYETVYDSVTGEFTYQTITGAYQSSCPTCALAFSDVPGTFQLSGFGETESSGLYTSANAFTYQVQTIDVFGDVQLGAGTGVRLFPGDTGATVSVDPAVIAHIDTIIAELPIGWESAAFAFGPSEVISGPGTGANFNIAHAAYTMETTVVPIPAPVVLVASACAVLGLIGCRRVS